MTPVFGIPTHSAEDGKGIPTYSAEDGKSIPTYSAEDGKSIPTCSAEDSKSIPTYSAEDCKSLEQGNVLVIKRKAVQLRKKKNSCEKEEISSVLLFSENTRKNYIPLLLVE